MEKSFDKFDSSFEKHELKRSIKGGGTFHGTRNWKGTYDCDKEVFVFVEEKDTAGDDC